MDGTYVINDELKKQYAGLYVLYEMRYGGEKFFVDLAGEQKILEKIFSWLLSQEYVQISSDHSYEINSKGCDILMSFVERYQVFLKEFDVYCAVDLEEGDFAFNYYHKFDAKEDWDHFLMDERWDDLRIAVAEFKGWDAVEIIFMNFINEGTFGRDDSGAWSFEYLLGGIWDEIQHIANTSIRMKSLAYEDGGQLVSAEEVLKDMINQGQEIIAQIN